MRFLADLDPGASVAVSWEPSETPA
jgi:hypothetical protein